MRCNIFNYLYLFCIIAEVSCWMVTGERQATRIRGLYLKTILRQDIGFFDTETTTGEVIGRMSGDTILIQEAMGEKVNIYFVHICSWFFLHAIHMRVLIEFSFLFLLRTTGREIHTAHVNVFWWVCSCLCKRMVSGFSSACMPSSYSHSWWIHGIDYVKNVKPRANCLFRSRDCRRANS